MITIKGFQDDLKNELEKLFKDFRLTGTDGKPAKFSIYKNDTPMLMANDEDALAPYIVIRLDSGKHHEETGRGVQDVKVLILICIYNDDETYVGTDDVLIAIQRIIEKFTVKPTLSKYYRIGDVDWTVGDTETYPYFFGGVELTFAVPSYTREDDYC